MRSQASAVKWKRIWMCLYVSITQTVHQKLFM